MENSITLIYTISPNVAGRLTGIYTEDPWLNTNSWWLWQIKTILIPAWWLCCDYIAVTFGILSVSSKNLSHRQETYRVSQCGLLSQHFFCACVCEAIERKAALLLLFPLVSHCLDVAPNTTSFKIHFMSS